MDFAQNGKTCDANRTLRIVNERRKKKIISGSTVSFLFASQFVGIHFKLLFWKLQFVPLVHFNYFIIHLHLLSLNRFHSFDSRPFQVIAEIY